MYMAHVGSALLQCSHTVHAHVLVGSPDFVIVLVTDLKLWTGAIPTLSNDVHVQQTPDRTVSGRVLTVSVVFSRPKTV